MDGSGRIESYRDLLVWQRAMDLAELSYVATKDFPREETYGMIGQIRRSAASVAANIAEGYGRESAGSYVNFLKTAQGSLKELETHVILSSRVGLASKDVTDRILDKADEIGRMLRGLIRSLQQDVKS